MDQNKVQIFEFAPLSMNWIRWNRFRESLEMDLIIDTGVGLWDFGAFLRDKGMIGSRPLFGIGNSCSFRPCQGVISI
jgi:hypothetical protein